MRVRESKKTASRQKVDSFGLGLCEFQRTWNRPDAQQWSALYAELVPHYRAVTESFRKAQDVAKQQPQNQPQQTPPQTPDPRQ